MFSTRLSRAATTCATSASSACSGAAHRTTSACLATKSRRSHQRRPSSSKASCPPDSSPSGSKPAPASKASSAADGEASLAHPPPNERAPKRVSRTKRSKTVSAPDKSEDHFAGLPAVPGTQHLQQSDLSVSSFFSLHRPLSLKYAIPPISSNEAFESLFESRKQTDPWENGNSAEGRPEDVVYALGSLFENLNQGASESQDEGMRWEVIQESQSNHDGMRHLDGPPRTKSMDEMVAEFKPFSAPPPPQPFPQDPKTATKKRASKPKSKSYETTIIVTEFTAPNGHRTYTASSSPIVRIPSAEDQPGLEKLLPEDTQARFPHRERRLERSQAFWLRQKERMQDMPKAKQKMFLISVKRQRKLKMKKHKYKKLMKRTRNLRRRQDRA